MFGTATLCAQADTVATPVPLRSIGFHHDEIALLAGYHQGHYGFAELGVGRNIYGALVHPYGMSYYIGSEVRVDRPGLWGMKAGTYVTGGFAMGVQYIHYMESGRSMEVVRPEVGIGIFKAKVTYGYNWCLTKPRIDGVSEHMISLSYAFRLKRLPHDGQVRMLR